ncbi:MAG: sigma-70 family RNA polymerase sigma factor [Burkholderiales bacterium]|nr:MAG: sigma-70 family RNA polymerase sigma factor [Burkholderiales bacterium]
MTISKNSFENQVLALLGPLQGLARRLTCSEADAEDLVAETVARAWRAIDSLESEVAFRAWVFRIMNNTFVSELRRTNARPWHDASNCEDFDEEQTDFSLFEQMHQPFLLWFSNPEQEFVDKLLREDLERALETLPAHHRAVVLLADLEEMSYAEIAEVLEVPVGTVRSRLARARSALQKLLWRQAGERGLSSAAVHGVEAGAVEAGDRVRGRTR